MSALTYRHNPITRVTHWANMLALVILFMSGLMIFNAYPHLHWGSKAEPDEAFFSIYAVNNDGDIRAYTELYGLRVETTGVLGLQNTEMGPAPRAFPSWITVPGFYCLSCGRRWHFFFGWLFALNGLLYLVYNSINGHMEKFFLTPRDARKILPMALYYLRIRKTSPQDGEYNPLQKLAYTSVFFILTPLIVASGLAMSPQMDAGFKWLPALFGGRQSARSFHFLTTFFFAFFTFGHVFMVATTGAVNNMRSMITGWYKEKSLRVEEFQGPRVEEKVESQTFVSETLKPSNPESLKPSNPETSDAVNPETLQPPSAETARDDPAKEDTDEKK